MLIKEVIINIMNNINSHFILNSVLLIYSKNYSNNSNYSYL